MQHMSTLNFRMVGYMFRPYPSVVIRLWYHKEIAAAVYCYCLPHTQHKEKHQE